MRPTRHPTVPCRPGRRRRLAVAVAALVTASAAALLADAGGHLAADAAVPADLVGPAQPLELRPLQTSPDRRIVDDLGRDVLLRGANVNSLGLYWQGDAGHPPTIAVTDDDWAEMAANGFSVVRLIVTWSRIEPVRGQIDQGYLDLVDQTVRAAARHGIYTVIDMHQDAWSHTVATTDPASCPQGLVPGKGWDGAPDWATFFDGATTCTTGDRYAAPAVSAAFDNFYANRDGIRDRFVASWAAVAARFAGRPEVAGFDFLNEPPVTRPAAELQPLYDQLLADGISAIRAAEDAAGAPFHHIVFVEPALPAADVSLGLVIPDPDRLAIDTSNVAAAPHNYAESIPIAGLNLTVEGLNDLYVDITTDLGVPLWIGEYGFWDTSPETLGRVARYAASEDHHALGGAWWQWRQSCGDPHHVEWQNGQVVVPPHDDVQLNTLGCPGNVDLGPTTAFLDVAGRSYPRATPGRIDWLRSDAAAETLDLVATAGAADVGRDVVVWVRDGAAAEIRVEHLTDVTEHVVPGGRVVTASVAGAGCYALHVGTATVSCPASAPPPRPTAATPTFTG